MYKPIKPSEIPGPFWKKNVQVAEDLEHFLECSDLAGEIRVPEGQPVKYAYAAYHSAIARYGYPIQVMVRGNRLFIRKKTALGAGTPKGGK